MAIQVKTPEMPIGESRASPVATEPKALASVKLANSLLNTLPRSGLLSTGHLLKMCWRYHFNEQICCLGCKWWDWF